MSFLQRHPYLFWQLVGWCLALVDFVFLVIAVFNDFGEWSYPVIVIMFIAALFAVLGSPFFVYFSRKTQVPRTDPSAESQRIRNGVAAIVRLRGKPGFVLVNLLFPVLFGALIVLTYQLGEHGHIFLGFVSMVAMVVMPFVFYSQYFSVLERRFMACADGARMVTMRSVDDMSFYYLSDLRVTHMPLLPLPNAPSGAMLDFLYNWLRRYLTDDRLTLIRLTAADLRRVGCVIVNEEKTGLVDPDSPLIAIPERQLDLGGDNRTQFDKECNALGVFRLPAPSQIEVHP